MRNCGPFTGPEHDQAKGWRLFTLPARPLPPKTHHSKQAASSRAAGFLQLGGKAFMGGGGGWGRVTQYRKQRPSLCKQVYCMFVYCRKVRSPVANPCPGPTERKDSRPHFTALQMPCCLQTEGLRRPYPAPSESTGAISPTAFAHLVSVCHILVALAVFQTLHQQKDHDSWSFR